MMNVKQQDVKEIKEMINGLLSTKKIGVLGTLDANNQPYLSTLPVIKHEGIMYAYVSRTAPHFNHLQKNEMVQIIFSENETDTANSYLAKRVSFSCTPSLISDDEEVFQKIKAVHGEIIDMLRKMDFELLKLSIIDGKAILGAGQAYYIDAQSNVTGQDDGKDRPSSSNHN